VNGKHLSGDIIISPEDIGALPDTTAYAAVLAADGRDISLLGQDGDTLSTVQTQDISGKLDKQAVYWAAGSPVHSSTKRMAGDTNWRTPTTIAYHSWLARTVMDNIGTRLIQTLENIYSPAGNADSSYVARDEITTKANLPIALSQLTNDACEVIDASYVHTDNNFTDGEKSKLAELDNNHFNHSYASLDDLQNAQPTAADGDYAYVGVAGTPAVIFIWDLTDSCLAIYRP
jgi:hypothetical protein